MGSNRAILPSTGPQIAVGGHFGNLEVVSVDVTNWEAEFRVRSADGTLIGPKVKTRFSAVLPDSEEDTRKFWEMLVDDMFKVLKDEAELPDFVKGREVSIDDDSTGDPALYVKVLVKPARGEADNSTVDRWNDFAHLLQDRLMGLRLRRLPYVQLGEWHEKR